MMKTYESRNGVCNVTVNNFVPQHQTPALNTCKQPSGETTVSLSMRNTKQKTNDKFGVEEVGESAKMETQESGTSELATSHGGSASENLKMERLKLGTVDEEGIDEANHLCPNSESTNAC